MIAKINIMHREICCCKRVLNHKPNLPYLHSVLPDNENSTRIGAQQKVANLVSFPIGLFRYLYYDLLFPTKRLPKHCVIFAENDWNGLSPQATAYIYYIFCYGQGLGGGGPGLVRWQSWSVSGRGLTPLHPLVEEKDQAGERERQEKTISFLAPH